MKVKCKYTESYLANSALIGFLVAFGCNETIYYKIFVEDIVLTAIIFGSGVAWSIIEERNK